VLGQREVLYGVCSINVDIEVERALDQERIPPIEAG